MPTTHKQIGRFKSPSSVDVTGIKQPDLGLVWRDVAPMLEKALGEGQTIEDVLTALYTGKAQLWIAATPNRIIAVCVTEIETKGNRRYCNFWLMAGTGINEWLGRLDYIEEWARANGCDAMTISHARKGWQRILRDYRTKTIALTKEL